MSLTWKNSYGDYWELIEGGKVLATVRVGRAGVSAYIVDGDSKHFSHSGILSIISKKYSKYKMKKAMRKAKAWCENNL